MLKSFGGVKWGEDWKNIKWYFTCYAVLADDNVRCVNGTAQNINWKQPRKNNL